MKTKLVPLLGIAFVVALISTGIFYGLFVGKLRDTPAKAGQAVVVAAHKLDRGSVLKTDDLAIQYLPEAPKGAFNSTDQAVGFTLLTTVGENEAIIDSHLATQKSIPDGMRAISIHVTDSSGIVTMLHPGNKVDVQVVTAASDHAMLRTVLQNVEVLATSGPDAGRPVVNLLVTPEQANVLGLADSSARVRLALRNTKDGGNPELATVQTDGLFKTAKPAAAPIKTASLKSTPKAAN